MTHMNTLLLLIFLSAFAGGVHVLSPDHWVPASILSWQRRWGAPQTAAFVAMAMAIHVGLGVVLYFALAQWFCLVQPEVLFPVSLIFVFGLMFLRGFRFSQIQNVQRLGPHGIGGVVSVVSLLGPCESIIPVLIKASSMGMGYLLPLAAFLLGTVLAASGLALSGQMVWNRPYLLARTFSWFDTRIALLPVAAGVALSLRFLLRLS